MTSRRLTLIALAAIAMTISACASSGPIQHQNSAAGPVFPVHQGLRVCAGIRVSNAGPVGSGNRSLAFTPWMQTPAGYLLRNPTDGACISSGFGMRPAHSGGSRNHRGIDLANPRGGAIYAAADGQVLSAGPRSGYGRAVEIEHGSGVRTLYAHMVVIAPEIVAGRRVMQGEVIGIMGQTGRATGVHLHYEVRVRGQSVNPLTYGPYRQTASR